MNEFDTYGLLLNISSIASHYPEGLEFCSKVKGIANRISSHQYRVAVIGEFKRGKSSLVNALLGTQILPTDILPMTAAVTHVRYSEKSRILIRYKSGETEENTVEQLIDYATKYDTEKEERASRIENITVEYPSVFCKNHIEIIDTPGLNDDDKMTKITLSVLGEIDTAVLVTSAQAPLSITEQNLVITLLKEQGIHHIFFVVTYIDLARRESDKDKIIETIRKRISGTLLKRAEGAFAGDDQLNEKAKRILEDPDVLGVSSLQAMEGFLRDDSDLLDISRFPDLKSKLFSFLTAAQSTDAKLNTVEAFKYLSSNIDAWKENREKEIEAKSNALLQYRNEYEQFVQSGKQRLFKMFADMDDHLKKEGVEPGFKSIGERFRKIFIKNICVIKGNDNTPERLYRAVKNAGDEALGIAVNEIENLENTTRKLMDDVDLKFRMLCPEIKEELPSTDFAEFLDSTLARWKEERLFPKFSWDNLPCDVYAATKDPNIMPMVIPIINVSLQNLYSDFQNYLGSWRMVYIKTVNHIIGRSDILPEIDQAKKNLDMDIYILNQQYEAHKNSIAEMSGEIL